jgi:hypothetical protein
MGDDRERRVDISVLLVHSGTHCKNLTGFNTPSAAVDHTLCHSNKWQVVICAEPGDICLSLLSQLFLNLVSRLVGEVSGSRELCKCVGWMWDQNKSIVSRIHVCTGCISKKNDGSSVLHRLHTPPSSNGYPPVSIGP